MTLDDAAFMDRALFLAERGRGSTSPNPLVGAVVVKDGVIVGQGAHREAGGPHAEIVALDAAGNRADGATLYCTLEPCAHWGRTGPCVDRIAAAGVHCVVAAVSDPNPMVAGAGFASLRASGVQVVEGVRAIEATRLNAPFFQWVTRRRPFVILKTAASLDGFVGDRNRRTPLTGATADRYFHRQRAEVDAIAVGSGTVLADDPLLTARGAYRARPLHRVIFDRRLRIPPTARVFSTLDAGPVIMIVAGHAADEKQPEIDALEKRGVRVERLDRPTLSEVLQRLADRGIVSLLVEGGPTLQEAFLANGVVDRVQWVVTPHALNDGVAVPRHPDLVPIDARVRILGDDVLMEFDVHRIDRSDGPR